MGGCCGGGRQKWQVLYPNGKTVVHKSETSAKLAAARVKGAKVSKVT